MKLGPVPGQQKAPPNAAHIVKDYKYIQSDYSICYRYLRYQTHPIGDDTPVCRECMDRARAELRPSFKDRGDALLRASEKREAFLAQVAFAKANGWRTLLPEDA